MPIPPQILARVIVFVVKSAPKAYKAGRVLEKYAVKRFGKYRVEIDRRNILGADGGMSQVIRFLLNDHTQEAWHVVVKAGRIIHKHILK